MLAAAWPRRVATIAVVSREEITLLKQHLSKPE
jgi:hypothetical protein